VSTDTTLLADHVCLITVGDAAALDRRESIAGEQLRDALLSTSDDDDVKAIILAGLTTGRFAGLVGPQDAHPGTRASYSGTRGLHQVVTYCKKVVIAEVDGQVGPTASALCLAADFVVSTSQSTFASPFSVPEANYPLAVLTMRANRTKAWMFRGGELDARSAYEAGFVNELVPGKSLRQATTDLGRRVALMPLDGLTVSKMNIGAAFDVIGVGREFDATEASVAAGGASW